MEMSKQYNQIKFYARSKGLPLIPVQAKDVSIITEPSSFYKSILDHINLCQRRIALSALYLGSGPKETRIVQTLCDSIRRNSNITINVALDANRARRSDEKGQSSVTVLEKILAFDNVKLNLVETTSGSLMSKLIGKAQKWNELLSTYHSKILVFDNDVLVTGANLSSSYFETRQDRYMMFRGSQLLSDYMVDFLEKHDQKNISMNAAIRDLNDHYIRRLSEEFSTEDSDSYVIPLFQFGPSNLTEKEDFLRYLDSILPKEARVYISSGYFSPSSTISNLNVTSVLAPSERTNGFFNGGGLLKYVPRLYSAIHRQYINDHRHCEFYIYDKPDWSFHAKGMWIEGLNGLYIHLVGSSNFNCRSSGRDFETQLVLFTRDKNLSDRLHKERIKIWSEARRLEARQITGLNIVYETLAKLLKSFL